MTHWIDDLPHDRCLAEISMWSADLARLADDMARIDPYADMYHFDVADGVFAPSFLFFADAMRALRPLTEKPFHVHLMVDDAILLAQIDDFADAGADLISLHVENAAVADAALSRIEAHGIAAGMVLRIETPVAQAAPFIDRLRALTLLGTAIGVKGQDLSGDAPARLDAARALVAGRGVPGRCLLCADGGIREHTVPDLVAHGAETVVMGSLAFGAPDLDARFGWLRALGAPGR